MRRQTGLSDLLRRRGLTFLLFGGKGGVGKTSMAAATALAAAERSPARRVLLFSTDPAPSLTDAFVTRLAPTPTAIPGIPRLSALELDARAIFQAFKEQYGEDIREIFQQGTLLDDAEAADFFTLDIPGLDEVMALKTITDFMAEGEYDLYIIDTAPTGHTLRLLALPDLLDGWIRFLAKLRWRYRTVVGRLTRREAPAASADAFLVEMKRAVQRVRRLLQDAQATEFVLVTIPEALAVSQTLDFAEALEGAHVPSSHLIINNLVPKSACSFCASRRALQQKHREALATALPRYRMVDVPLQPGEVRGVDTLRAIGSLLFP